MLIDSKIKDTQTQQTFIDNEFSQEVFEQTYKFGDENIFDTLKRVAVALASVEDDKEYWTNKFYEILLDFKFVPGGRILSNAGTKLTGTTMINCFVSGFEGQHRDSMEGILAELRRQALILKSEGGYGFCADTMRPRGAFIQGIANESPGSVKMLEMWDKQSEVITEGSGVKSIHKNAKGKIRKGAQMVTMSCSHPDIEEFITAKRTDGRLQKFNMSVLITDKFMDAVENNKKWELIFPDYEVDMELYNEKWNGNLTEWVAKDYPVKIYKTFENANQLWDLIMHSTYTRNEPGVLFVDTINRLNNLYYNEYISASNPCVVGDTLVFTNIGWIKIKNLEQYNNIKIITRDVKGELTMSKLEWVGITHKNDDIYEVLFDNNEALRVNSKHKFYDENFKEILVNDMFNKKSNEYFVQSGKSLTKILNIKDLQYQEDVYDLTANPNYNFFSLHDHDEIIIIDKIIINNIIELNYFDLVITDKSIKFAHQLNEEDNFVAIKELELQTDSI